METERRKDKLTREFVDETGRKAYFESFSDADLVILGNVRRGLVKILGNNADDRYIDITTEKHYHEHEKGIFGAVIAAKHLEHGAYERLSGEYPEHLGQITIDLAEVLKRAVNTYITQVDKVFGKPFSEIDSELYERTENLRDAANLVSRLADATKNVKVKCEITRYQLSLERQAGYFNRKLRQQQKFC